MFDMYSPKTYLLLQIFFVRAAKWHEGSYIDCAQNSKLRFFDFFFHFLTTLKGCCYAVARARGPIFESTRFPEILVLPTKFHWNRLSGLAPRLDQSFTDRQTDGNVQNKGTLASSHYFKNVLGQICSHGSGITGRRYALY